MVLEQRKGCQEAQHGSGALSRRPARHPLLSRDTMQGTSCKLEGCSITAVLQCIDITVVY